MLSVVKEKGIYVYNFGMKVGALVQKVGLWAGMTDHNEGAAIVLRG